VLSQSVLETGVIESWQGCFMLLSLPKFPLSYLFSLENPLKGYPSTATTLNSRQLTPQISGG